MSVKYVDNTATGSGTGASWANAWTSIGAISGVSAGDTVYISGGSVSQTYNMSSYWNPTSGTTGNPITYQVGQDAGHNGVVIFNYTGGSPDANPWVSGPQNVVISGSVGTSAKNILLQNYTVGFTNVTAGVTFTYIDFAGIAGNSCASTNTFTLSYCTARSTILDGAVADHWLTASFTGSIATDNQIHHNTISVPIAAVPGNGMDFFATGTSCNGYSIYNNTITGYTAAYLYGQHGDGLQLLGNQDSVAIYNNTFNDIPNYAVFGDAVYGGFTNFKIYNNTCQLSISALATVGNPGGIIFGVDGGYLGSTPVLFTNVIIANNIVSDYHANQAALALGNKTVSPPYSATFTGCVLSNNTLVNSGSVDITGNATSTVANNIAIATGAGATNFLTYTEYGGASNNLLLRSAASTLIGQGSNLSAYFTTDADGGARTVPWDVGPYLYVNTTPRTLESFRQPRTSCAMRA